MTVLHVIDSGGLYGAERMLLALADEQRRRGLRPVIASIGEPGGGEKPLEREAVRRGIEVAPIRMRPGPNPAGALALCRLARQERADVFHSHGYKGNILLGWLPRRLRGAPLVATVHGWTSRGKLSRMALYERADAVSLARADAVVLVAEAMRASPALGRLRSLRVIPNGVEAASPAADTALDPTVVAFCRGGFVIGAVGRLSAEKGFDILIAAVAGLARRSDAVKLVILGEGRERQRLEAMVRREGLEGRVVMPGYRERADQYCRLFHVFALSSLTEGWPIGLLEAMVQGVPVVATQVGGVPEILDGGAAGVMVEAGDAGALADALWGVQQNAAEARERAERAKVLVGARYSIAAMVAAYENVYRDAVDLPGVRANGRVVPRAMERA